ncbi:MAG TPA: DNA-binding protein [Ignisphaera sp.]|nr:DNA-binding protein [Ignisphaera sp.]
MQDSDTLSNNIDRYGSDNRETKKLVVVLDTAAFLSGFQLLLHGLELITTPSVIKEVRDFESVARLEIALSVDRVRVIMPSRMFIDKAITIAKDIGILHRLSPTDIEVIALALEYKGKGFKVLVATDDYAIQNIVSLENMDFLPIKTQGISKPHKEKSKRR